MRFIVLAAIAAIASPAVAADQFDLVCRGAEKVNAFAAAAPVETRYRIDLVAGRWCRDECNSTEAFAKVAEDRLSFRDHPRQWAKDDQIFEFVLRTDGSWMESFSSGTTREYRSVRGRCDVQTFSGFPKAETKF